MNASTVDYRFGTPTTTVKGRNYAIVAGGPAFAIQDLASKRIVWESLYRNAGRAVAIVAVGPDATGRWSAYIGAAEVCDESEEDTLLHVAAFGTKLSAEEVGRLVDLAILQHLGGAKRYRD